MFLIQILSPRANLSPFKSIFVQFCAIVHFFFRAILTCFNLIYIANFINSLKLISILDLLLDIFRISNKKFRLGYKKFVKKNEPDDIERKIDTILLLLRKLNLEEIVR